MGDEKSDGPDDGTKPDFEKPEPSKDDLGKKPGGDDDGDKK